MAFSKKIQEVACANHLLGMIAMELLGRRKDYPVKLTSTGKTIASKMMMLGVKANPQVARTSLSLEETNSIKTNSSSHLSLNSRRLIF